MKQRYTKLLFLLILVCSIITGLLFVIRDVNQVKSSIGTSRKTVLLTTAGDIIREFSTKNFDVSSGTASVNVGTLEEQVNLLYNNTTTLGVEFRNHSGIFQFKNYGEDWVEVGEPPPTSNVFRTIGVQGYENLTAVGIDTLELEPGAFINLSTVGVEKKIVIESTLSGKAFSQFQVTGQDTLEAAQDEPVQFVAGSNIIIETNDIPTPKQIIFSSTASGSGSGGGVGACLLLYTWKINGGLATGEFDLPRYPGIAGTLYSLTAFLEDSGTAGDNLVVDVLKNGSSVFTTKPSITANSGADQTTRTTSFSDDSIQNSDVLSVEVETFPTDSENLTVNLLIQVPEPKALIPFTWKISGPLVTGTQFDLPRLPGIEATIQRITAVLDDTGTGGSDLQIDILNDGTSIFQGGTQPTITANSGIRQKTVTTDIPIPDIAADDVLTLNVDTAPTDSQDLVVHGILQFNQLRSVIHLSYIVNGPLINGTRIDLPRIPGLTGEIYSVSAMLEDTGTGGSDLVVDLLRDGTSIYDDGGTKPTVTANSGANQLHVSTDPSTIELNENSLLSLEIESNPTDSSNLICEVLIMTPNLGALTIVDNIQEYQNVGSIELGRGLMATQPEDGKIRLDTSSSYSVYTWQVNGAVLTGTEIDLPRRSSVNGVLKEINAVLVDTGTGGDDLVIDVLKNGSSIFDDTSTKPTITANSGVNQTSIALSPAVTTLASDDILSLTVETAPTDSQDLVCTAIYKTSDIVDRLLWKINGPLVTGTNIDLSKIIRDNGTITSANAMLGNTGTGGDDLVVDFNINGISIFSGTGTKPTITANSGTNQKGFSNDANDKTITHNDVLEAEIETFPTASQDVVCYAKYITDDGSQRTFTWKIHGSIGSAGTFDLPRKSDIQGVLESIVVLLGNTGTGGDNLVIDILKNGTSIYTGGGVQPTISANSGTWQSSIITEIANNTVEVDDIVSFDIDTAPTGSENLICNITINTQ